MLSGKDRQIQNYKRQTMRRINMIVTETMKSKLKEIAESKNESVSELIRAVLTLMFYRIKGTKTKKHRREKKYRLISQDADDRRVILSFYADDMFHITLANIESDADTWSKAAFIRKILDIYIHYCSLNAEIIFIKLAQQAESDYQAKLTVLKNSKDRIIIQNTEEPDCEMVIVEYDGLLNPLRVMVR